MSTGGGQSVRGFNLYSFYAILLPGTAFTIVIFPLLPASINVNPILALVPLLAIGFVVGQVLHTIGVYILSLPDRHEMTTSHREFFEALLTDGNLPFEHTIQTSLCQSFVQTFNRVYGGSIFSDIQSESASEGADGDGDCADRDTGVDSVPENDASSEEDAFFSTALATNSRDAAALAYTVVRSDIHNDGRGRSRLFQSTYAFCRSVMVMLPLLWFLYAMYALLDWFDIPSTVLENIGASPTQALYTPLVKEVITQSPIVAVIATLATAVGLPVFQSATKQYKRYYVEYILADFTTIHVEADETSDDN